MMTEVAIFLRNRFGIFLLLFSMMACGRESSETPGLTVLSIHALDSVSSGSGLLLQGDSLMILGDDSPELFYLSLGDSVVFSQTIIHTEVPLRRIPRPNKPDLESLCRLNDSTVLAFPSGTLTPQRDSLYIIVMGKNPPVIRKYGLRFFYNGLAQKMGVSPEAMNIEGSEVMGDRLFLLDRGQNALLEFSLEGFLKMLNSGVQPEVRITRLDLPKVNGIQAGLSGLCQLGSEEKLLFSASVEDTPDWHHDGERMGSFIGIIDLEETPKISNIWPVKSTDGSIDLDKFEAVLFRGCDKLGNILVTTVTDNDDGKSKLVELRIGR